MLVCRPVIAGLHIKINVDAGQHTVEFALCTVQVMSVALMTCTFKSISDPE